MGKLHRKGLGLALRQIDQDAGDVVGLGLEIDAGDDVGAVFLLGKPRRGRIGGGLRQRVDGRALRIAFLARQRIGMDRDEQRRAGAARAIRTRSASGMKVSSARVISTRYLPAFSMRSRNRLAKSSTMSFSVFAARRLGAGVDAAMARIEHDQRPRIAGIGLGCGCGAAAGCVAQRAIFSSAILRRKLSRSVAARSSTSRAGSPSAASTTKALSTRTGLATSSTMREPPGITRPKRKALIRPRPRLAGLRRQIERSPAGCRRRRDRGRRA